MSLLYIFASSIVMMMEARGVVDAAKEADSVLLLAEDAVGFCIFRACVFVRSKV
jgi:hypothetical protein